MSRFLHRPAARAVSSSNMVIGAVLTLAVLAGLLFIAVRGTRGVPGINYYKINARFKDTGEIRSIAEVRVAGRMAGRVVDVKYDNGAALLKLKLEPRERYLRSDSTARIRTRNLLGLKYLDITPGTRGTELRDNATIPISQTSMAVDYAGLLSTFDAPTRRNAQLTLKGLGGGFAGRGTDINDMLGHGPAFFRRVDQIAKGILARNGAARRFAPSAESLAGAYAPVREQLARGFDPEARALAPFSDERSSVQHTLEQAPPALSALRQGLDASTPLLNETARFARAAREMTQPAPAALRATVALLREGRPAMAQTRPLLRAVDDAVSPTVSFLQHLDPVVGATQRMLHDQLRLLHEFGSRPCDVLTWGQHWRSAMSYGVPAGTDPLSDLDHSQGIGPLTSFRFLAVPPDSQEALLPDAKPVEDLSGHDPYPAPCKAITNKLKLR